jgi:GNAT superfamily N-acetyltransferase
MATILRPRVPGDDNDDAFLFGSWLKSFRAAEHSGPYPPDLYFTAAREAVTRILARPGVQAAVLEDLAADALVGFVVHEPAWRRWSKRQRLLESYHVVHYVYVLEPARGQGAARHMLATVGVKRGSPTVAFSFATRSARGLLGDGARYLPDAARYESKEQP